MNQAKKSSLSRTKKGKQRPHLKKQATHHKKRRNSQRYRKKQKLTFATLLKEISLTLVLFSLLFGVVQQLTFSLPRVEGYSMLPTLTDGERLFVSKVGKIRRFNLVYYRDPETKETSVRRVVGLPGEQLSYRDDQLIINDQETVERFLDTAKGQAELRGALVTENFNLFSVIGTNTLPDQEYFVLGDNRSYASDSREFGTIKQKDIIGIVILRWLPFHQLTVF